MSSQTGMIHRRITMPRTRGENLNNLAALCVHILVMKQLIASALAVMGSYGISASAAPSWFSDLSTTVPGKHQGIATQKLHYSLSWKGQLQAGHVTFVFGAKGSTNDIIAAQCYGGSQGFAAKLFPYQFDMSGKINRTNLLPISMHCNETDKEETQVTTVQYSPSKVAVKEISRPHDTGKDEIKNINFAFSPVFDAFSVMLLIRSHELTTGDTITQVIHPFKSPYLAKITVLGREKITGKDAIKLNVQMTKIMKDLSLKPYKKMKTSTLWISDDEDRIPLELRVDAFIGDVRMTLTEQRPL
jgi:hypothetical protein